MKLQIPAEHLLYETSTKLIVDTEPPDIEGPSITLEVGDQEYLVWMSDAKALAAALYAAIKDEPS